MAENVRNFTINFGPQHPAAHGVLRLVLELDGEIVERVDPHIGLLHRGTEKLIEAKTYLQAIPYFDRLDYVAPMNQEHAFCLAAEKLLRLQRAAPRAADPRALLRDRPAAVAHPQRHHAGDGRRRAHPAAVGLRGAREADGVLRARLGLAHARGVSSASAACTRTCRRKLIDDIEAFCDPFLKVCDDLEDLLTGNRIFKQRNVDIGVVEPEGRLGLGLLRRDGARLGRGLGPAQVAALRMLRRDGFRHSDRQERRLLRPLLHPHGRDAAVDPHHEAVHRKAPRARRAGRR